MSSIILSDTFSKVTDLVNLRSSLIAIVLVTLAVGKLIVFSSTQPKKSKKPNPPPLPPMGPSFAEFLAVSQGMRVADTQAEWVGKYGRFCTVPSPLPGIVPNFILVADPGITKELVITQTNQYRPPSNFTTRTPLFAAATRDAVGESLAGVTGDEWKWRRAAFLKEMHKSKLFSEERQLVQQIFNVGKKLCSKLDEAAETKQPVKVDILATEAAFDTILFFVFGKVLPDYDADEIRQGAKDLLAYMFASLSDPLFFSIKKWIPGTKAHEARMKRNAGWKVFDSLTYNEIVTMIQENKAGTRASDRLPGSILEAWLKTEPRF